MFSIGEQVFHLPMIQYLVECGGEEERNREPFSDCFDPARQASVECQSERASAKCECDVRVWMPVCEGASGEGAGVSIRSAKNGSGARDDKFALN